MITILSVKKSNFNKIDACRFLYPLGQVSWGFGQTKKIDTDSKAIQQTEFSEKIKNLNAIIAN